MPKTVIITGSSSGIGKATAIKFSNEGWNVIATMRSPEKENVLSKIPNVKLYKLDVTDLSSIKKALKEITTDFKTIDVLVNNAGFGVDGVFEEIEDKVIEEQFNTNVFGLMRMTREIIPIMRVQRNGIIIQISSMGGRLSFPLYSIYHATKWAVEGFSESLQYELKQFNIKLKVIEPGTIKTEFYGKSRKRVTSEIEDYQQFVDTCEVTSQSSGQNGSSPEKVANEIYKAATEENNRFRFQVGYPSPQLFFIRRIIPETLFFKMVRFVFRNK